MNEKRFTMSYAFDDEEYEYFDKGVPLTPSETCRMLNELSDENEQLRTRLQDILAELYCKDRKLEDLGINIECCDTDE